MTDHQSKYLNPELEKQSMEDNSMNLMDHVSTCRFFSFPISKELNTKKNNINTLSGAGSFFIPLGKTKILLCFVSIFVKNLFHRIYVFLNQNFFMVFSLFIILYLSQYLFRIIFN